MSLTLLPLLQQGVLVLAAIVLFLSFVLLAQTRVLSAIHAFAGRAPWLRRSPPWWRRPATRITCISRRP